MPSLVDGQCRLCQACLGGLHLMPEPGHAPGLQKNLSIDVEVLQGHSELRELEGTPGGPGAAVEGLGLRQQPLGDLGGTICQVHVALQGTSETALAFAHLARPTSEDVHGPGANAGLLSLLFSFRGCCCQGAGHLEVADTPGMHGNEVREGHKASLQSQGHASKVDVVASHGGGANKRKAQLEPAPAFPRQEYATRSDLFKGLFTALIPSFPAKNQGVYCNLPPPGDSLWKGSRPSPGEPPPTVGPGDSSLTVSSGPGS